MSKIQPEEHSAPHHTRHISLHQWERGLLLGSPGPHQVLGGGARRRSSVDLAHCERSMAVDADDEIHRRSKKQFSRGLSFSSPLGRESEWREAAEEDHDDDDNQENRIKVKLLKRDSSFSSSTDSIGDGAQESSFERSYHHSTKKSPMSKIRLLFSKSFNLERGQIPGDPALEEYSVSDHPAFQSRSRKFFRGGLFTSKSFGRQDSLQSWDYESKTFPPSSPHPKPLYGLSSSADTNKEPSFNKRFLARVLTFSKSFNSRVDSVPEARSGADTPDEFHAKKFLAREFSFSRSLDARGEPSLGDASGGNGSSSERSSESWPKKLYSRGLFFSSSLDTTRVTQSDITRGTSRSPDTITSSESWSKKLFSRGLSFSRSLDTAGGIESEADGGTDEAPAVASKEKPPATPPESKSLFSRRWSAARSPGGNVESSSAEPSSAVTSDHGFAEKEKSSPSKNFFQRGLFSLKFLDPRERDGTSPEACSVSGSSGPEHNRGPTSRSSSKVFFSRDWTWTSRSNVSPSPAHDPSNAVDSTLPEPASSIKRDSNSGISPKISQALKYWWSKRSPNSDAQSMSGADQSSELVLLEKVPANDQDSDELTVYVGERGGALTKYVLSKKIVQHHLFQVLLKCSQDELGSDYDYNSGVPIICDPALFLQVARVVGN